MPSIDRAADESYDLLLHEAVGSHSAGRLDEAEYRYRALLNHPQAQTGTLHFVLGLLLVDGGRIDEALAAYDLAAAHGYGAAELYDRRADLLRLTGRLDEALIDYDRAMALGLNRAQTAHNRAMTLAALGRLEEALAGYDHALTHEPDSAQICNNRGVALEGLGQLEGALISYNLALSKDQAYSHAHHNRGSVLLKLERHEEAAASFNRALAGAPERPESWNLLGMALGALLRHHDALLAFEKAVALRPTYVEAINNRSVALRWVGRFEDAVDSANLALKLDPNLTSAWVSRGAALARLNRFGDAIHDYDVALTLTPASASAFLSRGLAREALGDVTGAIEDFKTSGDLLPGNHDADVCMGLAYIRRGDFDPGFRLYQSRWLKWAGPFKPHPQSELWTGEQSVEGRTVLLHAEQGFGDVIQFCRFAEAVADLGARVLLQVQPALTRLMATLAGPVGILSLDDPAPPSDLHIPLMNLPVALGLSLAAIEGRPPYLSAQAPQIQAWGDRLEKQDRPLVGLVWNGNPAHENDHNRSISFKALSPLFETEASFASLQKVHRSEDIPLIDAQPALRRFDDVFSDFAEVAGLVHHCDAVITVDTAVAHLAGAMGKPTFILLPHFSDWRWMDGRSDSPWYPSARLFRQKAFGDWSDAISEAVSALPALRSEVSNR